MLEKILDYIEREPARFVGSCVALLGAIVTALLAFNVVSPMQAAALTASLAAIAKLANNVIVRALVMPMSKVHALVGTGEREPTIPKPPSTPTSADDDDKTPQPPQAA